MSSVVYVYGGYDGAFGAYHELFADTPDAGAIEIAVRAQSPGVVSVAYGAGGAERSVRFSRRTWLLILWLYRLLGLPVRTFEHQHEVLYFAKLSVPYRPGERLSVRSTVDCEAAAQTAYFVVE